jgi:hypothetical protein
MHLNASTVRIPLAPTGAADRGASRPGNRAVRRVRAPRSRPVKWNNVTPLYCHQRGRKSEHCVPRPIRKTVLTPASHQDLLVKKAGHHVDDKGNDDRTKQVRERGVR